MCPRHYCRIALIPVFTHTCQIHRMRAMASRLRLQWLLMRAVLHGLSVTRKFVTQSRRVPLQLAHHPIRSGRLQ